MTRWTQGWLLILVLVAVAAVVAGCVPPRDRDPVNDFTVDPKAFTFWVMPF
jgi:hypothetical protein